MARITDFLADRQTLEDRTTEPAILTIDDPDAGRVFDALSAETARSILAAVYEEPRTASELAAITETSVQNVSYHLKKLQDGDLVEVADTWYSDQGNEMNVYAPTNQALVLFGGAEEDRSSLRAAIARILGAVGVVTVASILIDVIITRRPREFKVVRPGDTNTSLAPSLPMWISPGTLFFLGCIFTLLMVAVWWGLQDSNNR